MNGQVEYSNEPDDHDFGLLYRVSRRNGVIPPRFLGAFKYVGD